MHGEARADRSATKKAAAKREPNWRRYERLKREFVDFHPNATPAEYDAAMREFARLCGV